MIAVLVSVVGMREILLVGRLGVKGPRTTLYGRARTRAQLHRFSASQERGHDNVSPNAVRSTASRHSLTKLHGKARALVRSTKDYRPHDAFTYLDGVLYSFSHLR